MVYNYTKPRRRTAALDSSPGPCYALPSLTGHELHDPRSVHSRGPAYPFGVRHTHSAKVEVGPGPPGYFPDRKIYRTGRDGVPHYSLSGRVKEPVWFSTPGPGAYYPENCSKRVKSAPPAYSFGSRPSSTVRSDSPGPVYPLSHINVASKSFMSSKRQAPSYSLSGRYSSGAFDEDLRKTPGPGSYDATDMRVYRARLPEYSVVGRVKPPTDDSALKPGPDAYRSERVWAHKRESPHFSFGIRHSSYASTMLTNSDNNF